MDYFRLGESTGLSVTFLLLSRSVHLSLLQTIPFSLMLMNPLDYEIEHFFQLTIQVRDLGENSFATFVTIEISVLDENDNDPQAFVTFLHPFYHQQSKIFIPENTPIGQMLAHVSISDEDDGPNGEISWRMEEGNEWIAMKMLDQRSFVLVVNHLIDRESVDQKSNRLLLIISDHGEPSRSIRLEYPIEIGDVNDNPPIFNRSINCHRSLDLWSNRSFGSFNILRCEEKERSPFIYLSLSDEAVMEVQATDADIGENGRISYSIVPADDHRLTINDQGQLFLIDGFNQSEIYLFQILAIDHGIHVQWNSTINCSISTLPLESSNDSSTTNEVLFEWNVLFSNNSYLVIVGLFALLLLLFIVSLILCLRRCFHGNKTYHLYVTVPRQDEHFSPTVSDRISTPSPSLFPTSQNKPLIDSAYESTLLLKHESRPVSLSISTTTTCTSYETDTSSIRKWNRTTPNIVRLAEEENSEI